MRYYIGRYLKHIDYLGYLKSLNYFLIVPVLFIVIFGFYIQYSSSGGHLRPFLLHQLLVFFGVGIAVYCVIFFISRDFLFRYVYLLYVLSVLLLVVVSLLGKNAMGAKRWIQIMGISLQPAEFFKITFVLMLARYFSKANVHDLKNPFFLAVPALYSALPLFLILKQPSLGTVILISTVLLFIYFAVGVQLHYFGMLACCLIISAPFLWKYMLYDYQKTRVRTFFYAQESNKDSVYNILQSKIAIGSGGLRGKGLVSGSQTQLRFLPERQTDFVLSVIAEELGFFGVSGLIFFYTVFCTSIFFLSFKAKDIFDKLALLGIGLSFFLHFIINASMVSGLLPVVGMPLPLVSYGGNVTSASILGLALILKISSSSKVTQELQ